MLHFSGFTDVTPWSCPGLCAHSKKMCTDWVLQPGSLSSEAKALYRALYGDLLESSAQAFPRLCFRLKGHLLAEPFLLNGRLGYRLRRVGRGYVREKFFQDGARRNLQMHGSKPCSACIMPCLLRCSMTSLRQRLFHRTRRAHDYA